MNTRILGSLKTSKSRIWIHVENWRGRRETLHSMPCYIWNFQLVNVKSIQGMNIFQKMRTLENFEKLYTYK